MQIKINEKTYTLISNLGSVEYMRGARRNVVRLDTDLSYTEFKKVGVKDNVKWSILQEEQNEKGEQVVKEYDNSNYNLLGDIVIHSDNKVSFFMCESTNAELLNSVINDLLEV